MFSALHAPRYFQPDPPTQRLSYVRGLLRQVGFGNGEAEEAGTGPLRLQQGRASGSQRVSAGTLGLFGSVWWPKRRAPGRRDPIVTLRLMCATGSETVITGQH